MNFFLVDVWKQSKLVFVFFVVFILGTIWSTFWKSETTPFFLWAHYSEPEEPGWHRRTYIVVNDEYLDLTELTRPTREIIQLPTEYFVQLEQTNYETGTRQIIRNKLSSIFSQETLQYFERSLTNSPKDKEAYMLWLIRYIEGIYDIKVETMEIGSWELVVLPNKTVGEASKDVIAKYQRQ